MNRTIDHIIDGPSRATHRRRVRLWSRPMIRPAVSTAAALALGVLCVASVTSPRATLIAEPPISAALALACCASAMHHAIRHRHARRLLRESLRELRITQEAGSMTGLSDLLPLVCRTAVESTGCDRATVYLWSERFKAFIPVFDLGTPPHVASRLRARRIGPAAIDQRLRDGEAIVLTRDDVEAGPGLCEAELHSLAAIPLPARGRPLGCLLLGYDAPPAIDAATLEVARGIARHAASPIERARLLAKTEKTARFRAQLAQLAAAMHAQSDPVALAKLLSSRGAALFGVGVGAVLTRQGDRLVAVAVSGAEPERPVEIEIAGGSAIATSAFATRRPVFANDVTGRVSDDPIAAALGLASVLVVPLVGQRGPLGCLVYGDRTERHSYSPAIADEGVVLGEMVAAALERAQYARIEEARRHAERHAARLARHAAELARARNAALDAAHAKAAFLANMSHEIRTPMTAILGYVRLLSDACTSPEEHAEYVTTIRRNGEHLLRILNDVLDLSKIEAGRMSVERTACSPVELVEDVASLMRARARERGLDFAVTYDGPIPERVHADPTRLRQILINVVGNAVKFTEHGSVRVDVGMVRGAATTLRIAVTDTGCGISEEARANLFEAFAQADASTTRTFGGTGLGLAISKRLAHLLGGDITVDGAVARGSTFTITIDTGPLDGVAMLDHARGVVLRPESPAAAMPSLPTGARVLLAEDALDNQKLLALYLRQAGAAVDVAADGVTAYEKARGAADAGRPYDVVLMDVQMPRLDGHHAAARLRNDGYHGTIVALTAHALAEERAACLAAGCDDFLAKPVEPESLIAMIARYAGAGTAAGGGEAGSSVAAAPMASRLAASAAFEQLLHEFVDDLPARVAAMETDLRAADLARLAGRAHQLKGTAGSYGLPSLSEAAGALEAVITAERPATEIAARVARLSDLCRRIAATRTRVEAAA